MASEKDSPLQSNGGYEVQQQQQDDDDDAEVQWQDVDPPPHSGIPTSRAVPPSFIDLINYNDEELPRSELHEFHEGAYRLWATGFIATSIIVMTVTYLRIPVVFAVLVIFVGLIITRRVVDALRKDFAWDVERRRGDDKKSPFESVEYLNHVLKAVWPILDPDLFVAGIDLIEDALKALSPAVVRTVRIGTVAQGENAMRLLGLRHLSSDFDITSVKIEHEEQPIKRKKSDLSGGANAPGECEADDADNPGLKKSLGGGLRDTNGDPGRWINLEASFAYRKLPPPHSQANQMHMVIHLGFGVKKLLSFKVPVWVELRGLHGKIRLRLEMISEPPFVRHVKFCFPQRPQLEIVAKPLRALNVMTLPILSSYVMASIQTVLDLFTAPKSYTIDLSRFFLGSDIALKTRTVGIVCLVVHEARNLLAADIDGKSDPYVLMSFAHVGKALYATKVKKGKLSAVWEELAFLKVAREELDEEDYIRLSIMDHDRFSSNDMLGSVLVSLGELHEKPGEWVRTTATIQGAKHRKEARAGVLSYSAAFFPLSRVVELDETPALSKQRSTISNAPSNGSSTPTKPAKSKSSRSELPEPTENATTTAKRPAQKERPTYAERGEPSDSRSAAYAERMRLMLDGRLPANPAQKTGIIGFQVHQIAELLCAKSGGRGGERRVREKETKAEEDLPSSYVNVFLNDEQVYRTRLKPLTSAPYFNAGSEVICRDWTTARFDFAVMNYRDRDHDQLIGFHSIELSSLLSQRTQHTQWVPLVGGQGHGRLRFSVLFKPLDIRLPKPLYEWSLGTIEIVRARARGLKEDIVGKLSVEIDGGESVTTNSDVAMEDAPGSSTRQLEWTPEVPMRLPFFSRLAPVNFSIDSVGTLRTSDKWQASLWLTTIGSDDTELEIPLVEADKDDPVPPPAVLPQPPPRKKKKQDPKTKQQAAQPESPPQSSPGLTPHTPHTPTEHYSHAQPRATVGVLELTVRWTSGMASVHGAQVLDANAATRASYELYLKRTQLKARERKLSQGQNDDAEVEDGEAWSEDDSLTDEDASGRGSSIKIKPLSHVRRKMNKMKVQGGGTGRWMVHGVKLAKAKLQKSSHHQVQGPAPEQEIQSAL